VTEDEGLTYADAGVDIREEAQTVEALVGALRTGRNGAVQPIDLDGQFAGAVRLGDTALVLCTDGAGSKVMVAEAMQAWDTIGIDCIAMNVNDALCVGAEPVAFVDYLALEEHRDGFAKQAGEGLAEGARQANVAIVGGETATLPGVVEGFDVAGTCLAVAHADELVTGQQVQPGDRVIGVPSSGIHSNGLTLAREAVDRAGLDYTDTVLELDRPIGRELLEPTRIYTDPVLDLLDRVPPHGLVHVTGGGVRNFPRARGDVAYHLDNWPEPPAVFDAVQRLGDVPERELFETFNMGVGFAAIVDEAHVGETLDALSEDAFELGHVTDGEGVELPERGLSFDPEL
jgi:phosphoribosylformylglycinamidine cyclo-ligase